MSVAVVSAVIGGLGLLLTGVSFAVAGSGDVAKEQRDAGGGESRTGRSPSTDQVSRTPDERRAYGFRVRNVGKAAIRHLTPTLVDSFGKRVL